MVRGAAIALVAPALAAAIAGCGRRGPRTCDETALRATIEVLEADLLAEGAEARAIDGLAAACPRLHPGFLVDLRALYTRDRGDPLAYFRDPALNAARRRVCADPEAWVRDVPAAPLEENARVLWDACDFHRLGLLEEGERPRTDDNLALFVFAWLERDGVDRALVRRLGRGLMIATASEAALGRRCAEVSGDACDRYLGLMGLALPSSRAEGGHLGSLQLVLGVDGARWGGQALSLAEDGGPPDRLTPLARAIQGWVDHRSGEALFDPLAIAIDRRRPYSAALDALRVASQVGVDRFALVARSTGGHPVSIPIEAPPGWRANADFTGEPAPLVVIDGAGVHLTTFGDTRTFALDDLAPLTAERDTLLKLAVARFRVRAAPETPYEAVFAVVDALRGAPCEDCLGLQVTLDREPRFPARSGDWEALSLAIRRVTVEPGAPPWLNEPALRAELEPRLDALARCLRDDPRARLDRPSALLLLHGDRHDRDVVLVGDAPRDPLPPCVPAVLGPLEEVYEDRSFAAVEIGVIVPAEAPAPGLSPQTGP
ncbi:MAG: hypothetical protein R3B09_00525 [Nannocystaceae bacterium]